MTWYLLAYDVRDNRRLQRLHRFLKSRGLALQDSVFLIQGERAHIDKLLDAVDTIVHRREDDVRLYPIPHPGGIWLHGHHPQGVGQAPPPSFLERALAWLKPKHR
jgi:CRISPR-associated protein Cas2